MGKALRLVEKRNKVSNLSLKFNRMKKSSISFLLAILLYPQVGGYAQQVPFTLQDREKLTRLEEKVTRIEGKITQIEERITSLEERVAKLEERVTRLEERVIRLEERIYSLEKRIDSLEKRIDDLRTFMLWGFGILFGDIGLLIGFVIWDRRTALQPAIKRIEELERREKEREEILREEAKKDPELAEKLKKIGWL